MAQEIVIHDEAAQKFLTRALEKAKEAKDGGRAYAAALSSVVFADVISHFEQETGSEGPWDPWSKVYADHMGKIGKGGNKILQDTGRLRQAFLPTNYRKVSEGILWFNPAKTKSGFPYAYAHNEGGPKLPQRDFMYLSDEATDRIAEVTLNYVLEKT